ncbi:MAG: hypothetical protein JW987_10635 [Anaerolineaceae bacterium]|nr:hypothetical protein [Anaerolineaceae bacterium]
MSPTIQNLIEVAQILGWASLWALGGCWVARGAFRLAPEEEGLVGFSLGLVLELIVFNFLARTLPILTASWLSAGLVFGLGFVLAAARGFRQMLKLQFVPWHWLGFTVLLAIFFSISRGMAIFDDFVNLTTLSTMATGEIPPRFALDPAVPYGYHYLLHLLASQVMNVGHWYLWNTWDLARSVSLALAVILGIQWTRRVTGSLKAGLFAGALVLFASGMRWMLLFLPDNLLGRMSQRMELLGTGAQSGPELTRALGNVWAFEGGGPIPLPFAFANGLLTPGVLSFHISTGLMILAVIFLLLLTFNRTRNKIAFVVLAILISATGLLGETSLLLNLMGWALITLLWAIHNRSLRLPANLWCWWLTLVAAWFIIAVQGGAWSDVISGLIRKVILGLPTVSYQTIGFQLLWPPAIVSTQLGAMPLTHPLTLLAGVLEMGPLPFILPLIAVWGWKALKQERWFEAALAAEAIISLATLAVGFTGSTGIRNTNRLYSFLPISLILATPLLYWWLQRRSGVVRAAVLSLAVLTMVSGALMFFLQLPAAKRPVYSYFLTKLDTMIVKSYWNQLEPDALVFDSEPIRGVAIFGRHTNAATTWFDHKPEFQSLVTNPDPVTLRAQGYWYIYLDESYWHNLPPDKQAALEGQCVVVLDEVKEDGYWRQLLDIRGCR